MSDTDILIVLGVWILMVLVWSVHRFDRKLDKIGRDGDAMRKGNSLLKRGSIVLAILAWSCLWLWLGYESGEVLWALLVVGQGSF